MRLKRWNEYYRLVHFVKKKKEKRKKKKKKVAKHWVKIAIDIVIALNKKKFELYNYNDMTANTRDRPTI